jgi:GDP-mannose 6-dehydrogenase
MKISIFGLGYVGIVSAACLAQDGHEVIGVDVSQLKVDLIRKGSSPIHEPGLNEILQKVVLSGHLIATLDAESAVRQSDVSLVCVGTPTGQNGHPNFEFVKHVCGEIGAALGGKQSYHVVVIRSTILPGTVQNDLIPIIESHSKKKAGIDFGVCMNPEFMREGSAINDFYHPGSMIIGELDQRSGDPVESMYSAVDATATRTSIPAAEMVKFVSNSFHALKIVFGNEIGNICKAHGIDGQEVMEIFCSDRKLNISPNYLKPGFAFGGSCLPKDLRAITYRAKELDLDVPLLNALIPSNQNQIQRAIRLIEGTGHHRIGVLGLSFKSSTDDVRESPTVIMIETLVGRGYEVMIYDEIITPDNLIGANRAFLERELPHIASLMCSSVEDVVSRSQVIVIANASTAFKGVPEMVKGDQVLIDLVGICRETRLANGEYHGICW